MPCTLKASGRNHLQSEFLFFNWIFYIWVRIGFASSGGDMIVVGMMFQGVVVVNTVQGRYGF